MDIQISDVCRGDGKVFFRLRAEGLDDSSLLSLSAYAEGAGEVPLMAFPEGSPRAIADSTLERALVVAVPLLTCGLRLLICASDPDGDVFAQAERVFSPRATKWVSRLNGRTSREAVEGIRDYDVQRTLGRVTFSPVDCLDYGRDGLRLLRGVMRVPCALADEPPAVRCFDGGFSDVARKLRQSPAKVEGESGCFDAPFWEIPFAVDIPVGVELLVLGAYGSDGRALGGFETISRAEVDRLCSDNAYRLEDASRDSGYDAWMRAVRLTESEWERQRFSGRSTDLKFSIVVPLEPVSSGLPVSLLDSMGRQTYGNWELVVAGAAPDAGRLRELLHVEPSGAGRVVVVDVGAGSDIVSSIAAGVERATGDFIAVCGRDVMLEPNMLFEYARAIESSPDADALYCDEDRITSDGRFAEPFFKPDFSIDYLRTRNYIGSMMVVRASLLRSLIGQALESGGAWDYSIALMAAESARDIQHVAKVLCHWHMPEGFCPGSENAGSDEGAEDVAARERVAAVQAHLDRLKIEARVSPDDHDAMQRVEYAVQGEPLVSVIVPNCDCAALLDACLRSIRELTTYANYEVVIVENNSKDAATFDCYERVQREDARVRVAVWEGEGFNFSQLVNFGVEQASGDYLLLLNNDIEVISPRWIEEMLGICQRDDVGVVGAKLFYPDDTIQHAGVVLADGAADHVGRFIPQSVAGYFQLYDSLRDCSAVTAACLMTKRAVFEELDGFDSKLSVAYNDVDFCLRVRATGRLVVFTPYARLYHFESFSRGLDELDEGKRVRFMKERAFMHARWATLFVHGDPYYNPNFHPGFPDAKYYRLKPLHLTGRL